MSNLSKYMDQIRAAFPTSVASDVYSIGRATLDKVSRFLTERNAIHEGAFPEISVANESLSFDDAINQTGVEELSALVQSCGVRDQYVAPCCEMILTMMDRCLHRSPAATWNEQSKRKSTANNAAPSSASLSDIYPSDTVTQLTSNVAPSSEAFGVNVDLAMPDLKIAITVAIMNFHTRLLPRILPTKSINQPEVQYTKEYLEVYDLADMETPRRRLLDLYTEPEFAKNELKLIVPLMQNEENAAEPKFLVRDGVLKFGVKANLLKLSTKDAYGYSRINRTDLIAENVKIDCLYLTLTDGTVTEEFKIVVPLALNRLTRVINAEDVAIRNADIRFRVTLNSTSKIQQIKKNETTGEYEMDEATGDYKYVESAILANFTKDTLVLEFNVKPTISLKFGDVDCLAYVNMYPVSNVKGAPVSDEIAGNAETGTVGLMSTLKAELDGYSMDARFSEENLRKTSIAVWTHRSSFSYDIPIGRNYVFDYAIGQEDAENNATNLTKVIGIGQDHIALNTVLIRTLDDVADRIRMVGANPEDRNDYVGTRYVAGDKVRPTVYQGTLDFTNLNIIRDADRPGDIKQKAITYLNAMTTNLLADSLMLHQLEGAGVTFRVVTSMTVLGKILAQPHIHQHMDKEDGRDIGDGVEYVLVLPNGVRMEFVTSTFHYMKDKLVAWPIIKNNAESELNFAMNYDYGTLVANYTPSGEEAHHRLFANIRELPIVTNPVGFIIDIKGMDFVNGITDDGVLRPTFNINGNGVTIEGTIENNG